MRHKLRFLFYRGTAAWRLLHLWWREEPLRASGRVYIGGHTDVATKPGAEISIGKGVAFMHDSTLHFYGKVEIGSNCYFNRGCYLVVHERLRVGDNCIFGQYVSIHDQDHLTGPADVPPGDRGYVSSPIVIEDNVWVGANATILRGVRIGYGAVIGANSVVTKDVPPHSLAAGVPARVVKRLDEPVATPVIEPPMRQAPVHSAGLLAAILNALRA